MTNELDVLSAIIREITGMESDALQNVLRRITDHAQQLLQADLAMIMLRDDQMGCWIVEAASGTWHERLYKSVMLWQEFPLSVQALETKHPVIGEHLSRDHGPEIKRRNQFGDSMLTIPLLSQGVAFGVLVLMQARPSTRERWNIVLAQTLADYVAVAIVNARLYEASTIKSPHVEARIQELQHLAENLAHDVKAPGERIQGLASLLRADSGSQLSHNGMRWLDLIEVHGKELRRRAEHILALARIGSASMAVEAVDPALTVQDVLMLRSSELEQAAVRVEVQPGMPLVACHEAYLRQVFDNLISNATKFSACHTNRPIIRISWEQERQRIFFTVSDNGPGISLEDQERVFTAFVRLKPDETPGSGIGLTIVRRIIELYGGRVTIESQPNGGCSIKFSLPSLGDLTRDKSQDEPPKWTYGSL
jgi:signal transduction histidine kinase